jgi:hypothetical protein
MRTLTLALALLAGCDNGKKKNNDDSGNQPVGSVDRDGDGFDADDDCDDYDASVNPDAEEVCDGIDNNCDGSTDDGTLSTWYADNDGDDFGDDAASIEACVAPEGFVDVSGDCDDEDGDSWPGAPERCDDVDNDCDGDIDEEITGEWYADDDADGYGDAAEFLDTCDPPTGYVADDTDCDDQNSTAFPGGVEVCDGADNNCDGTVDEPTAVDASVWYTDNDTDGFGDASSPTTACDAPTGHVSDDQDCDDTDIAVNPDATEICDGVDNDCDTIVDTVDDDGDTYLAVACGGLDCDDTDNAINPAATESWYDGVDQDCDGAGDYDADADGYDSDSFGGTDCDDGTASTNPGASDAWYDGVDADCSGGSDYDSDSDGFDSDAHGGTDCDDTDGTINTGATETWYDGVDQDCDGAGDYDADADGYDSDAHGGTDCDDGAAATYPGASDAWYDGVDTDCGGGSDYDSDLDGYDSDAHGGTDCDDTAIGVNPAATDIWYDGDDTNCDGLSDYDADGDTYDSDAYGGTDCDDADSGINPGAPEVWYDGDDQNCDGLSDYDRDGDSFDSERYGGTDCDDLNRYRFPGATERWYDGIDQDCALDDDYDADADGYQSDAHGGDDCDDTEPTAYPGGTDIWYDGIDGDCDGASDYDFDEDGYDSDAYGGTDCADLNAARNPGATEIWYDGIDTDCGGDDDDDADADGFQSKYETSDGSLGTDCNDFASEMNSSQTEVADDGFDNDCDGTALRGSVNGGYSVTNADITITGDAAGDRLTFGDAGFGSAGDVNGDGIDDLIIGAVRNDTAGTDRGAAYVMFGPITAGGTATAAADAILTGAANGEWAGRSVAGIGDVDSDGFDDLAIASYSAGGSGTGAVYMVAGPVTGTTSLSTADTTITADASGDLFSEVAWVGDVNSDGIDDLMVGAQLWDGAGAESGGAFLFFGPVSTSGAASSAADVVISGDGADHNAGSSLGGAGDVNGDGVNDVLVAAKNDDEGASNAGAVYIAYGPFSTDFGLGAADVKLTGETADDGIGRFASTTTAGDTNGDGFDDIIIGSKEDDSAARNAGAAYIINGSATLSGTMSLSTADAKLLGHFASDLAGESVGAAGDVDGDGTDDVIVGSAYSSYQGDEAGAVYIVTGPMVGTVDLQDSYFHAWSETAGARAAGRGVGDLDNDGDDDVMLGAWREDGQIGGAYLFFSSSL